MILGDLGAEVIKIEHMKMVMRQEVGVLHLLMVKALIIYVQTEIKRASLLI